MSLEHLRMASNVQLVRRLADGGACFCTRGVMLSYDVDLFIVALAKTVIRRLAEVPGSSPGRPWRYP
jgi:hypothetical protein